jgi:hypothetical protein
MTSDADRFWDKMADELRQAAGFATPTPEEIEAQLDSVEEEALTDEQLDAMVAAAHDGTIAQHNAMPDLSWIGSAEEANIEEDIFALCRNRGDDDPEVDELLERQRQEALNEQARKHEPVGQHPDCPKAPREGD